MRRIFLDTNVYIIGFKFWNTNSAKILKKIENYDIVVTQSDYLFEEVLGYFRRTEGRDSLGLYRRYLLTVPNTEYIDKYTWSLFEPDFINLVGDKDDLPHICCYFADNCDYFITTNRRLTQMKIGEKVNFINPYGFVEYLGLKPIETPDGV